MVEGSHKRNQVFGTFRCLSSTFFLERETNSHKHDSHVTLNQQTYRCHLPVTKLCLYPCLVIEMNTNESLYVFRLADTS